MVDAKDVWWGWQAIADDFFYCGKSNTPRDLYYAQYMTEAEEEELRFWEDYWGWYQGESDFLKDKPDVFYFNGRIVYFEDDPEPKVMMFLTERGNCELFPIHQPKSEWPKWQLENRFQHWVSSNPVWMPKCIEEAANIAVLAILVKQILRQSDCQKLMNISQILSTDQLVNLPKSKFVETQRQLLQNELVKTVIRLKV